MSMDLSLSLRLGSQAPPSGGGGGSTPPDAFSFTDVTSAALSTEYTSNTVSPTGGSGGSTITVTGGTYSLNGGSFTSSAGTWNPGDTVAVKGTSSGSVSTNVDVTLDIGGVSDVYRITTVANSEASALILRMATDPGATRRGVVDTLYTDLKAAGTYTLRDAVYVFAAHESGTARLNWKSTSYTATAFNGGFTIDRGYAGDDASVYVDTNFADNTGSVNWTQDSADLYFYINASSAAGTSDYAVGLNTTAGVMRVNPASAGTLRTRIHSGGDDTPANATRTGGFHINRSGASAVEIYRNGSSLGTSTTASAAPGVSSICTNKSNTLYAADQIAVLAIGGSLTSGQAAAEHAAFLTFLTAIGAQ